MAIRRLANSNILLSLETESICKVSAGVDGIEGFAVEMSNMNDLVNYCETVCSSDI